MNLCFLFLCFFVINDRLINRSNRREFKFGQSVVGHSISTEISGSIRDHQIFSQKLMVLQKSATVGTQISTYNPFVS